MIHPAYPRAVRDAILAKSPAAEIIMAPHRRMARIVSPFSAQAALVAAAIKEAR